MNNLGVGLDLLRSGLQCFPVIKVNVLKFTLNKVCGLQISKCYSVREKTTHTCVGYNSDIHGKGKTKYTNLGYWHYSFWKQWWLAPQFAPIKKYLAVSICFLPDHDQIWSNFASRHVPLYVYSPWVSKKYCNWWGPRSDIIVVRLQPLDNSWVYLFIWCHFVGLHRVQYLLLTQGVLDPKKINIFSDANPL